MNIHYLLKGSSISMSRALIKDTLREIRGSFGRFFSILMIVAIGVAFFAGVKAAVPDMKHTADQYFDDYNMMDIRVVSTMGLTEDDVNVIRNIDGVSGVFPTSTKDVLTQIGTNQLVLKVHALPIDNLSADNPDYINQVKLIEGRLPEKSGECVVEKGELKQTPFQIGDTITLASGDDSALSDTIKQSEYTIVGTVQTPYYLSFEKGSSTIGSGTVDDFIMIPQEDFISDIYTEINITVAGAKAYNSYDDAYFEVIDKVKNALENSSIEQCDIRFADIKKLAQEKLDEGRRAYEDGKITYEAEIKAAEETLDAAKTELILGRAQLTSEQSLYAQTIASAKVQIAQGKEQLKTLKDAYIKGENAFQTIKVGIEEQLNEINKKLNDLLTQITDNDEEMKKVQEQLKDPNLTALERQLLEEKLNTLETTKRIAEETLPYLEPAKQALQTQLDAAEQEVLKLRSMIETQEATIAQKEAELAEGEAKAASEFSKAETKLREGQTAYEQGKDALEAAKKSGLEELELAKEKLDKAEMDVEDLSEPQWYVLDRHSHYSYMDYGSVADRMDGIAKVFPLFFFLVAALVCLTTMTRMVDEQRGDIGTLKALGYSKNAIAFKFISYAFIASIFGSILGCLCGMYIFPLVIFNAWNLMYTLPPISFVAQPVLAIGASMIVISITVLAAYFAVYKELVETPALLMRPKAPRSGKKIILERFSWLWSKLSFTQKVTARNLFRYKKRFFMTVIGISGCTALLVAGFGIQDSIAQVVNKQYGEILKYDVSMNYAPDTTLQQQSDFLADMKEDSRIEEIMAISQTNGNAIVDGEQEAVTILSPVDTSNFKDFISLHKRGRKEELELPSDGALISEKLAMNADIGIGDTLEINDADGITRKITIKGVFENYVGHYIAMSPSYYKQIFHIRPVDTTLIARMYEPGSDVETTLGYDIMSHSEINSVSFYSGVAASFSDTIASLSFIVIVLVIAAGMLAFVVLYNLTNVNISERLREIATIKVLGFYDKEVAEYVYRENVLLTIIGALCGLILGIGLHRMIMNLAEMESIMFGRNIDFSSFLISMLITLFFAMIVNLVMYRKLKRIPMVESLKSVE